MCVCVCVCGGGGGGVRNTERVVTFVVVYDTNFYRSLLSQITGAYVYFTPAFDIQYPTWKLTKIDTYYRNIKRPFYWNAWVPVYRYKKLRIDRWATILFIVFRECSVFRPLNVFAFRFNPSVRQLRTSCQSQTLVIKSQTGVRLTA